MLVIFVVGGLFHVLLWKSDVCLSMAVFSFSIIISRDSRVNSRFPQWNIIHLELETRIHVISSVLQNQLTPLTSSFLLKTPNNLIIITQSQNLKVFNFWFPYSISNKLFIKKKSIMFSFCTFLPISSTVALDQMLVILHSWTSSRVLKRPSLLLPSLLPIYLFQTANIESWLNALH